MLFYTRDFDDYDISLYSTYIAKLAAVATPGDPPPLNWRSWFSRHYQAMPGQYRLTPPRETKVRACRASLRHGRNLHVDRDPGPADSDAVA